jgi:SAM-dependent methyltransferase
VLEQLALAPPGRALDVACGAGRHALAIARRGWPVDAVDRSWVRCSELGARARAEALGVRVVCADLERLPLVVARYALIVNTLYLDRALVPALVRALLPGGLFVFETFTSAQLATGHPRNPAFVLQPGEILRLAAGLQVLAHREGPVEREGRIVHLASLAARAPLEGTGGGR